MKGIKMGKPIDQLDKCDLVLRQVQIETQINETHAAKKELFVGEQERDSKFSMTYTELETQVQRRQEDLTKVLTRQIGPVPGYPNK